MPRKPKFVHPVRQVRTCLALSQVAFARLVGCSPITIQRVENGSLKLSEKLANTIMDATGADPLSLRSGPTGQALDMRGEQYTKFSFEFFNQVLPADDREFRYLALTLSHYIQLMLIASNRQHRWRMGAVFGAIQDSLQKLAEDFRLQQGIHSYLVESGHVDKRRYRVSDLRRFPGFARIVGFKDDKRFSPDTIIPCDRPKGWIPDYILLEDPVLPEDAAMKLNPNASYLIDNERPIPQALQDIIDQALYWEIKEFRLSFAQPGQKG